MKAEGTAPKLGRQVGLAGDPSGTRPAENVGRNITDTRCRCRFEDACRCSYFSSKQLTSGLNICRGGVVAWMVTGAGVTVSLEATSRLPSKDPNLSQVPTS